MSHQSAPQPGTPPSAAHTATVATVAYWERVQRSGCDVPADRSLPDLTVELVNLLGSPDAWARAGLAAPVLSTWVGRGVYDDLLPGLGDGMCAGLGVGRGEQETNTVFRRSYSALVLAAVVQRDNSARLLHPDTVLRWGDRTLWWFLGEQDLRGYVDGAGWAYAIGHGADVVAALAASRHVDAGSQAVLLDAVADRLLEPTPYRLAGGEDDRLAYATMTILHRNALDMDVLGPWLERVGAAWPAPGKGQIESRAVNCRAFLRALHLQLLLGVRGLPRTVDGASNLSDEIDLRIELLKALGHVLRLGHPFLREPPDWSGGSFPRSSG